jgi:hypothetical protein
MLSFLTRADTLSKLKEIVFIFASNLTSLITSVLVTSLFARRLDIDDFFNISLISSWVVVIVCAAKLDHEFKPLGLRYNPSQAKRYSIKDLVRYWTESTLVLLPCAIIIIYIGLLDGMPWELKSLFWITLLYPYIAQRATWINLGWSSKLFFLSLFFRIAGLSIALLSIFFGYPLLGYLGYSIAAALVPELLLTVAFVVFACRDRKIHGLICDYINIQICTNSDLQNNAQILNLKLKNSQKVSPIQSIVILIRRILASYKTYTWPIVMALPVAAFGVLENFAIKNGFQAHFAKDMDQEILSATQRIISTLIPIISSVVCAAYLKFRETNTRKGNSIAISSWIKLIITMGLLFSMASLFSGDPFGFWKSFFRILFGNDFFSGSTGYLISLVVIISSVLSSALYGISCSSASKKIHPYTAYALYILLGLGYVILLGGSPLISILFLCSVFPMINILFERVMSFKSST